MMVAMREEKAAACKTLIDLSLYFIKYDKKTLLGFLFEIHNGLCFTCHCIILCPYSNFMKECLLNYESTFLET